MYWAQQKHNVLIFFSLKGFLNEVFVMRILLNQGLGKCYQPQLIIIITKTLIILDITQPEFGNIYCLNIHYLIATIRVVTKISSCRVFVVSSRRSRTQSWTPPPPTPRFPTKNLLKCNFYPFINDAEMSKRDSRRRMQK